MSFKVNWDRTQPLELEEASLTSMQQRVGLLKSQQTDAGVNIVVSSQPLWVYFLGPLQ